MCNKYLLFLLLGGEDCLQCLRHRRITDGGGGGGRGGRGGGGRRPLQPVSDIFLFVPSNLLFYLQIELTLKMFYFSCNIIHLSC